MLTRECPKCKANCEKQFDRNRIISKWKAIFKNEDESFVIACTNCQSLYFIPFWTLIVQAAFEILVIPWMLAVALFSRSFFTTIFAWIGIFAVDAIVAFSFAIASWREIPRADYPKVKQRYSRISLILKFIKYPISLYLATAIAAYLLYP